MISEYNGNNLISNGLLFFYSSWISDCNLTKDYLNNLTKKYNNLVILKINTTKYYNLKQLYKINAIPSFIYIKDNQIISQLIGFNNQINLDKWISKNF